MAEPISDEKLHHKYYQTIGYYYKDTQHRPQTTRIEIQGVRPSTNWYQKHDHGNHSSGYRIALFKKPRRILFYVTVNKNTDALVYL